MLEFHIIIVLIKSLDALVINSTIALLCAIMDVKMKNVIIHEVLALMSLINVQMMDAVYVMRRIKISAWFAIIPMFSFIQHV